MANFKGTQGNWIIKGESYDNYISVGTEKKQVCKVNWGENDFENAKLIASAPQLLNALQTLLEDWKDGCVLRSTISLAEETINKALNG